ncbi:KUP/HAK/KT family potassium transporter [Mesorhizobium sp. B2-4-12]|uniref:KUP/HAK/KT family potassium transporter n=1 Tax=Mesorhizobium sp. B2-4-12 TaxID=2589937 RepID=UPI0032B2B35E
MNGMFMLVDLIFLSANALKLLEGGWFPLLIAGAIAFLMLTWRSGLELLEAARAERRLDEKRFIAALEDKAVCRVPGTAAFLSAARTGIPLSLSIHLRHNKALQERVLLVSVVVEEIPVMDADDRAVVSELTSGFESVILRFGFMEMPDIPGALAKARVCVSPHELLQTSYYIGRETVIPDANVPGMWRWREAIFMWMQRNSATTGASFGIPSGQLVEIGTEIRI